MKKKIIIIGTILVILGCISALVYAGFKLNEKEKKEDSHLVEITHNELIEKTNNKESLILVFTQTQCSHCAEYKPVLKSVLSEYDIYAYEIVLDHLTTEEKAKIKDIANVGGTPATVFIEEGIEKNSSTRLSGTKSASKLVQRFKAMGYIK